MAGITADTLAKMEQGAARKWEQRTALGVYHALSRVVPLTEAEAHDYLVQNELTPGLHGTSPHAVFPPPGRLPDDEYIREVAANRVVYAGSDRAQRPPLPTEPLTFAGYPVGASAPQPVTLTPTLLQLVSDLVATVGIIRAEEAVKALLTAKPPGSVGGSIAPPPGAVAIDHAHGVREFLPVNPPAPNVADPAKPKARKLR